MATSRPLELRRLGGGGGAGDRSAPRTAPGEQGPERAPPAEEEPGPAGGAPRAERSPGSDGEPRPEPAGPAADYGLLAALLLLAGGVALVVVAYAVPREARVDPEAVTARQMERLELYYARLGSRLDRCIIAGLGLLTLGGLLLCGLLLVSLCRGELSRGRSVPASGGPRKTYGSIHLRLRQLHGDGAQPLVENEIMPVTEATTLSRGSQTPPA